MGQILAELLLLLPRGRFSALGLVIWSVIFATLGLSAEHLFAMLWVGMALAILISLIFNKRWYKSFPRVLLLQWALVLSLSALLALLQGGFITEAARNLASGFAGIGDLSGLM